MDVSRNEGGEAGVDPLNAVRNLQEDREKKAAEAERRLREMEEERMKVVPFKCCSYLQEDGEKKAAESEPEGVGDGGGEDGVWFFKC